jgi:hypothetical protein
LMMYAICAGKSLGFTVWSTAPEPLTP